MSLPPSGEIPQGAIRFNTDSQKLEFYAQGEWWIMSTDTPNLGTLRPAVNYPDGWQSGVNNPTYAFDGSLSNGSGFNGGSFGPFTYTFSPPITGVTQARMYVNLGASSGQVGGTTNVFKADGSDVTAKAKSANAYSNVGSAYIDVTSEVGSTWNTFTIQGTSGSTNPGVYAIEVNGETLTNVNGVFDSTPGVRGVWGGGYGTSPSAEINEIRYINISSTGDTQDFGDISAASSGGGAGQAASPTRGLFMSGNTKIDIDFITFASTGNATTFGNSTIANGTYSSALSSSTRGIQAGGNPGNDTIEYVTISSTGNAVDFGNLVTVAVRGGGAASPTRGLIIGGRTAVSSGQHNVIQFITIATLGDSQDFGDLNAATRDTTGTCSNPTRAIVFAGVTPTNTADIDYITIATTGNSTKFGDLSIACDSGNSVNSPTRGVHAISRTTPSGTVDVNTLEYVNIATTGNSVDFGDSNNNRMRHCWPTSNGHGGL